MGALGLGISWCPTKEGKRRDVPFLQEQLGSGLFLTVQSFSPHVLIGPRLQMASGSVLLLPTLLRRL